MADESKLKAQAREWLYKDTEPGVVQVWTDRRAADFAHEQVKAETADLRDKAASALSAAQNRINILWDAIASSNEHALWWSNGDPKPLAAETRKDQQMIGRALTKLQKNK